ncbi:nuclear transport factor 2 family protein [Mesobacterium sp. TK19101]|uniref:Nuclear transport factor 2 family protein n=1 Tax=Mesobacterium hydrothermale TaxID=3111907 RepID=A0ABU6HJJ5_9RHOB|nr:nuclear transport factor 2 family protein [Mesobacterium sp. TK19101]MEC3862639.1 nuclear transport factor 2 family protein [Mesobacterium sp. TK19101]
MGFQTEKQVVQDLYAALDGAPVDRITDVLADTLSPDALWRGFHPFGACTGPQAIAESFWQPLRQSLTRMQRRQDIFFAGRNEIDGFQGVWVVSMGHLMGLFDQPWLGIAPTGKMAFLRYCEFNRVADGRITETAMYFDIPHLMMQAGLQPFPPQTAAHLVQPGPMTHDGLLFDDAPEEQGRATLAAINAMIGDLGTWQLGLPLEEELARTWHDDMIWWGPAGIGATYTIKRYAKQHSAPFRAAFKERSKTRHIARLAEGAYGGFFGWPNFTALHTGGFMGMPASDKRGEMRVIDIYRRDGDKLAENWIFIDLLHFWNGLGVDILDRMARVPRT